GLVETLVALRPPREARGAELLELVGGALDVLNQHAEMVNAAEVEPEPLVPAEVQHGHVERAVAQEYAVGLALPGRLDPADLGEVERLLVEFRGRERIFRGDGDVTKLRHTSLAPGS